MDTKQIIASLWVGMPFIAKTLIQQSQDMSRPENRSFFENPDDVIEHEPKWHQWGIITHSKMFQRFLEEKVPGYLETWNLTKMTAPRLAEEIDGVSKQELLSVVAVVHDLGKFTVRKLKEKEGERSNSFKGHESASGKIVRSPEFSKRLKQGGILTDKQIEYVAKCAELHYVLSIIRTEADKSALGCTLTFANSDAVKELCRGLIVEYHDFALEVGLLFLADSLAKTEFGTDAEIVMQDAALKDRLRAAGANPKLISAIKESSGKRGIAKTYLEGLVGNC